MEKIKTLMAKNVRLKENGGHQKNKEEKEQEAMNMNLIWIQQDISGCTETKNCEGKHQRNMHHEEWWAHGKIN